MKPVNNSVLFIENVGNLVCPAMFDLGEKERVVIISVTEGDDKPLKYPDMFYTSTVCIINKIDLLPYVPFSVNKVKENALKINRNLQIFEVSCTTGEGLNEWYIWLKSKVLAPDTV
jgi:hydrogenase nickel incorporation protein HypB